jgi:hypothetical protein
MKNKTKIRIIKDKVNNDSYTFLTESQPPSVLLPNKHLDYIEIDVKTATRNLEEIYKKKKVLTNEDMVKSSKGLKFSNPSQRNHSSIYE